MTEYVSKSQPGNNEIDLLELAQGLWTQKWLILVVSIIITSGAAVYAWLSEPVYEASVSVMPPTLSDVEGFNLGREAGSGLGKVSSGDVYAVFKRNLLSDQTKRQFFRETYLPQLGGDKAAGIQELLYREFLGKLSIQVADKAQPERYSLAIQSGDAEQAARWLGDYVELVASASLEDVLQNSRSQVSMRSEGVRRKIGTMRDIAKVRREDRLARLKEALAVAESVGIENPPVISSQMANQLSAIMEGDLMYMRGARALKAEIRSLETRPSDDPFIPDLRSLEERQALYKGIEIDPKSVAVFRMDGQIEVPEVPVKPRKFLMLAIGAMIGGSVGIFIAFIRLMMRKHLGAA